MADNMQQQHRPLVLRCCVEPAAAPSRQPVALSLSFRPLSLLFFTLCLLSLPVLLVSVSGALVEHSTAMGLERLGPRSHIAAVGDFDGDKHSDFFVLNSANISKGEWSVETWLWDVGANAFELNTRSGAILRVPRMINNIVPGDFNYDGKLDLLVSGPMLDEWKRPVQWLRVYFGTLRSFEPTPLDVLPHATDQVLVADLNNDLMLDLFGTRYSVQPPSNTNGSTPAIPAVVDTTTERTYWLNSVSRDGLHRLSFHTQAQPLSQAYPSYDRSIYSLPGPAPASLSFPHSCGVVDLDGDCQADLVVTSSRTDPDTGDTHAFIEIWINRPTIGPVLHSISPLPPGAGQLSFADVDYDGNIDILVPVFPVKEDGRGEIHIYYNQARRLCHSEYDGVRMGEREAPGASSGCRSASALCTPDPDFYFDFMSYTADHPPTPSPDSANTVVHHFAVPSLDPSTQMYSAWVPTQRGLNPLQTAPFTLRLGDMNLDGYPDLLLSLQGKESAIPGGEPTPVVELWINVPCDGSELSGQLEPSSAAWTQCAPAARSWGRRSFSRVGMEGLNAALAAHAGSRTGAAFIDLEDNGELDIVFTARSPDARTNPPYMQTTHAFINHFEEDAYFLTALASNGVCHAWCNADDPLGPGVVHPSPKPYGVSMPGASFRLALTDLAGEVHTAVGAQLSQSAYLALQVPQVTFGLGRTNTFLDAFAFGIGINTSQIATADRAGSGETNGLPPAGFVPGTSDPYAERDWHSKQWVSLVPNAQVVVFPYPPDRAELWDLELFVAPSSQLLWVFISWAVTLTLLAIVIGALHLREQREDDKEKRKQQLLFSF